MKKYLEKLLDWWHEVPKSAKQLSYGFLAGFILGLIL